MRKGSISWPKSVEGNKRCGNDAAIFFFFSGFNQRRINFSISFFVVVIMDRIPKLERKIFPANQIRPIGAGSE